ncbi:MAG: hypothetical protein ACQERO_11980 [Bacteroidota bacterium]
MSTKRSSKPHKTGTPLSDDDDVIRLGLQQSSYDFIGANQFNLSSEEKSLNWKRISVWETSLSTIQQITSFVNNPKRKLVIELNVQKVRSIRIADVQLDVKWDRLNWCIDNDNEKRETYIPGCEGHCGLEGLYSNNKKLRKKIRKELADLATSSRWWLLLD